MFDPRLAVPDPCVVWGGVAVDELLAAANFAGQLRAFCQLPGWQRLCREMEAESAALLADRQAVDGDDDLRLRRREADARAFLPDMMALCIRYGERALAEWWRRQTPPPLPRGRQPDLLPRTGEGLVVAAVVGHDWYDMVTHPAWRTFAAIVRGALCGLDSNLEHCRLDAASQVAVLKATTATLRRVDRQLDLGRRAAGELARVGG